MRIGEPETAGKRRLRLPLTVELPLSRLTFLRQSGSWAADVELRLGVRDERGQISEVLVIPLYLEGPEEPGDGAMQLYRAHILLRRGEHDLVVALHDTAGGTTLTSHLTVRP